LAASTFDTRNAQGDFALDHPVAAAGAPDSGHQQVDGRGGEAAFGQVRAKACTAASLGPVLVWSP
jgi:hypothetical protein